MNTITLIGYVGKDAESRTFDNGNKVTSFTLATTERGFEAFNTKMLYGNYFSKAIDNLEKELDCSGLLVWY